MSLMLRLMYHLDLSACLMQSTPESSPVQPSSKLKDSRTQVPFLCPGSILKVLSFRQQQERTYRAGTLPLNYLGPQVVPVTCPYMSVGKNSQGKARAQSGTSFPEILWM